MKTFTKAIACLLSVVLLLTAAPLAGFVGLDLPAIDFDGLFNTATAAATVASGTCGENLTWTLDEDGTLTISGTGAMTNYYSSSYAPWYSNRSAIKKVDIEDGVITIGRSAFYVCDSLVNITIPDSVTRIGDLAFGYCDSLVNITIPDSVTRIGEWAFVICNSLVNITIPASVTSIGSGAFRDCYSLESITVDEDNANYSSDAFGVLFNKNKTQLIQSPIGNARTEYEIPDSVTSIGNSAFKACHSIERVTFGKNSQLTTIDNNAFFDCINLVNITIPDGVTTIGNYAFRGCTSLASVTFGKNSQLTSIGSCAFRDCTSLVNITIPDSVTSIGSGPFSNCDSLVNITVDEDNATYSSDAFGVLFNNDKTELIQYPIGNARTEYKIPDSVTSIGDSAFHGCTSLASVTFGENSQLTTIGSEAFYHCDSLVNITIPDSVTSIGDYAFEYCISLKDITIKNPDCVIYDSRYTIPSGAIIKGYAGSTAQAYAEKYNRKFVAIDVTALTVFEPYTIAKVSADGFAVVAIGTTVADILAASNATAVLTASGETVAETAKLATGMQLVLQNGATVVDSMEIAVLGDADGDGTISAGDARLALRISVGLDRLDAVYLLAAKVNGEATITAGDARLLLRASVGLEDPVEWFNKFGESV